MYEIKSDASLTLKRILEYPTQNIAELLDKYELGKIAARCYEEYALDDDTRADWKAKNVEALKIAEQQWEKKSHPWPGASNVKYPLIAGASMQFAARAYPAILNQQEIVKAKITGRDDNGAKWARAQRIQKHMNYQLTEQMPEWEEDMDKMLHGLPVLGTYFKKTYFSPIRQRPISDLIAPQDFVVNNNVKRLEDARRGTHVFSLFKNQILERQAAGLWLDDDLKLSPSGLDDQGPYTILEQHRWLDLDGDGYEEPYVVTLVNDLGVDQDGKHQIESGGTVVRITPLYFLEDISLNSKGKVVSIKKQDVFSKFGFIPDFCGRFMDVGFGQLLLPINEAINTMINQLVDAGTISNLQGGFMSKQLKLKGGAITLEPGEWRQIDALTQDLRGAILPLPVKEPSMVLFQMLGFLVDAGKSLSSVSEVLSGEQSGVNVPATTTLALIEQGLKVFSAINKRIYRSLKQEFGILYQINSHYLEDEEYFRVLDEQQVVARSDYALGDCDIYPVADPSSSTDVQKLIKAEALMKTVGMPGSADPYLILHKYYEALKVEDLERFHPAQPQPTEPPAEVKDIESKMQERQAKLPAEVEVLQSTAALNYAKAQSEAGSMQMEEMAKKMDMILEQQRWAREERDSQLDMALQLQKAEDRKEKMARDSEHKKDAQDLELLKLIQTDSQAKDKAELERERMQHESIEAERDRLRGESEDTSETK